MDIRRIQDVHLSDIELRTRYYGLISAGMIDEAKQMVISYPQLNGKVMSAQALNQFVDSVMELEQNYYTNVEGFLREQLDDLQLSIDELVFMSDYDSTTQYEVNNFVIYGDNLYYCYVIPPIGTLPTDSDYWIELNLKGTQGVAPLGVNLMGMWEATKSYKEKDMVIYNNSLYVAKSSSTGVLPTNTSYWIVAINNKPQTIYIGTEEPKYMQNGSLWIKITEIDDSVSKYFLSETINIGSYMNYVPTERG